MFREFSYSFNELEIHRDEIATLLGYPDGILPDPFGEYLTEAMSRAEDLCDIHGAIFSTDSIRFSDKKDILIVDGVEIKSGKIISRELRNSDSIVFFICTAGKEISELSQTLLKGNNPVLGYVYDVLGSVTVEAATDKIHQEIRNMAAEKEQLITNRYSPGYCQWSVADQHKLFSFFPETCCGITLTESALMHPIKSVSGIIGMGKEVKYRKYTCNICELTECFYRNRQKE